MWPQFSARIRRADPPLRATPDPFARPMAWPAKSMVGAQDDRWPGRHGNRTRAGPWSTALVAKEGGVALSDDVFHVLRAPAGIGDGDMTLAQPEGDLEVLLLQVAPPAVLFSEQLWVNLLQPLLHLVRVDVEVFAPVVGQVVQRLFQVAAALLDQRRHEAIFIHAPSAQPHESSAALAEDDELAGVAVLALAAALAQGRPFGGFGRSQVADEHLFREAATTGA